MNPNQLSPEDQEKLMQFNIDLKALLVKYNYVLGAIPFILADGRIAARPEVFPKQVGSDAGIALNGATPEKPVDSQVVN